METYQDTDRNHQIGLIKPSHRNKYLISVFLYENNEDLMTAIDLDCRACYIVFGKITENVIGAIFLEKTNLDTPLLSHEISHAAIHYMKFVRPKFKLSAHYSKLNEKNKNEERFCIITENIMENLLKLLKV